MNRRRLRAWALCCGLASGVLGCSDPVAPDERVVLFESAARLADDGSGWVLPIHGWVYEPADSRARKAALSAILAREFGLETTPETELNFDRRVNLFLADNERGKRVAVQLPGARFPMPASEANGHFETEVRLDRAPAAEGQLLEMRVALRAEDERRFVGNAFLQGPRGITVISDIDDTVKLSEVLDRRALLDNTFFRDFRAVPGMAAKYAEWAAQGVAFHFVSSSPWQLYEPLREFLLAAGFPRAVLHLKSVRLTDETLLDLFKPGAETKPKQIAPILAAFPGRRFVLVGDSGEQDPEVYAALLKAHPKQILRVYIRNVSDAKRGDARFRPLFAGVPASRWALFRDPASLALPAAESSARSTQRAPSD